LWGDRKRECWWKVNKLLITFLEKNQRKKLLKLPIIAAFEGSLVNNGNHQRIKVAAAMHSSHNTFSRQSLFNTFLNKKAISVGVGET
jgi:hypothetical protein